MMPTDVITKLLSTKTYKDGNTIVYVNDITGGSGLIGRAVENVALSGIELALSGRLNDYTYY